MITLDGASRDPKIVRVVVHPGRDHLLRILRIDGDLHAALVGRQAAGIV